MKMRLAVGVMLALTAIVSAGPLELQAVPKRIVPVDQGTKDPSFRAFRTALIQAARNRHVQTVIAHTAKDVRQSPEEAVGSRDAFIRHWRLDRDPAPFLEALIGVLEGGGRFYESGEFIAPYTFTEFHGEPGDFHDYVILTKPNVPVYEKPSAASKVRQRLSYAVLPFGTGPPGWIQVQLGAGIAYVQEQDARQPSGPHAYFRLVNGKWKLAVFVEGLD